MVQVVAGSSPVAHPSRSPADAGVSHDRPSAFDKSIEAFQQSGKRLPLLFEHTTQAVGYVDPYAMHSTDAGLVVFGEVDRSTDEGKQVWAQIKAGTAGFSIGFMAKSRATKDGGRILTEIDVLEISATSTPAHPATRVLGWKSTGTPAIRDEEPEAIPAAEIWLVDEVALPAVTEEMVEEINAMAARDEKRNRPIKVKRFEI